MPIPLELVTELPVADLVAKMSKGTFGGVNFSPPEKDQEEYFCDAKHFRMRIMPIKEHAGEMMAKQLQAAPPRSSLWFWLSSEEEGITDAFKMSMTALDNFKGDLALILNGGSLFFKRVDSKLFVDSDVIASDNLKKLLPSPYEESHLTI